MRTHHPAVAAALSLGVALGMPATAKADWLGLADGTYDLTLTCTQSTVISCPAQIQGTVTILGAGATFLSYTVNGEVFSGDPVDGIFQNSVAEFQVSTLTHSPYSFADLRLNLSPPDFPVPDDQWWVYCTDVDTDSCTPTTTGSWEAVLAAVPEPFTLALFTAGLAGLGLRRRR